MFADPNPRASNLSLKGSVSATTSGFCIPISSPCSAMSNSTTSTSASKSTCVFAGYVVLCKGRITISCNELIVPHSYCSEALAATFTATLPTLTTDKLFAMTVEAPLRDLVANVSGSCAGSFI